jgi:hypothetical protein
MSPRLRDGCAPRAQCEARERQRRRQGGLASSDLVVSPRCGRVRADQHPTERKLRWEIVAEAGGERR